MIRSLVIPIAFVALAASCAPLLAQTSAGDAAEAAQLVAARADQAFERIDPDSEMTPAIAAPEAIALERPLIYPGDDEVTFSPAALAEIAPAPRGPASRMIESAPMQAEPAALASSDPFVIKSILPIEGSIRYGDWFWDETAAPGTGKLVITVARLLYP